MNTVRQIIDSGAEEHPDKIYLTSAENGQTLSWANLRQHAQEVCDFLDQENIPAGATVAKKGYEIASLCGLSTSGLESAKILLVESTGIGPEQPFSGEKLSPVLTVYRADDFKQASDIATEIMDYQGKGHSIGIHTTIDQRALDLGLTLPVCRVIVNQIHCYATGGSFDNSLPFSLSMGCGTWGKNNISDNMNYKHYLNTTRVVRTIEPVEPSVDDMFSDYWHAYQITPLND